MCSDIVIKLFFRVYVLLVCVDITGIYGYSFNTDYVSLINNTRSKRQSDQCIDGFKCTTSGECIGRFDRCDGRQHCKDGSDELDDCKTAMKCPGFLFVCDYGACIDSFRECDGKKDCHDNSDENHCNYSSIDEASKIQSNCKSDQFHCLSGNQCISLDDQCDGVPNCDDGSDETEATCRNKFCPGFTYVCDYGACVNGFAKCNGVKDCADNSDEKDCEPSTPKPKPKPTKPTKPTEAPVTLSPVRGCTLPKHPNRGKWHIQGSDSGQVAGMKVAVNTLLTFTCENGYKLSTDSNLIACFAHGWSAEPPTCLLLCPRLYDTATTKVHCYKQNVIEIKCDQATAGDSATFDCAPYYEPYDHNNATRYCNNGMWNYPAPHCIPVCGEKRVSYEPLIVNGENVISGDYPWVTAVFQKINGSFINVCGGSMLSQKVILTAAHCVTNKYGEALSPSLVNVGVGKYYNKFHDERDSQAQYSDVEKILVHSKFKSDSQHYASDIAFLITKDTLLLSKVVQPVCYSNLKHIPLKTGSEGVVTGWGYTLAGGSPSEELKEITVPYKDDATCNEELPQDFARKYITYDKFCAGHKNKSTAVCKGDSGGGLVFQNYRDERYYVHGIVSITSKTLEGCNIELSSLYTRVISHYEWLERVVSTYSTPVIDFNIR